MVSTHKLKSVDFYRKIPRDLTEASLSGAGLSIVAAFSMIFLFGMELNNYLTVSTSTSVIVDKSSDGEFLRIDFNVSFPALSCEFASVDVSDVLGTNRLNITKTIRKYPIDSNLKPTGSEFHSGPISGEIKHDDEGDEEYAEGSFILSERNFDRISHKYPILVVNFYAPWCYWSNRLKPSWEKAAKIIRERYDPEVDGRILLGKVDCTEEVDLCRRNHIQGYPSIRIFRKGSDVRDEHGHHEHESYYGDRDTDSLVNTMENLVAPIPLESHQLALESNGTVADKRPAPVVGGCRIEGFVRVKKVPGNLVISARSGSHSFDSSKMNMSHIISHLSFGKKISAAAMSDMKRMLPYLGVSHDKLDGQEYIIHPGDSNADVTIEHYLQVVKTEVITRSSREQNLVEYEYTAHSSLVHSVHIPVAKFHFELSPMQVLITEKSKSFSHFITNICAIIGGVFTVAGIVDSILHNTLRLMKKIELGKNF
ncbi:hypothetical protein CsSME_00018344 [Camellia sinensis var. sinensis]|uniref:protein disulfide isomerase-like 5-4 n=1 Tax=Camellia sinensis TaxID=4442 RepID=UPI001035EACB|nr:protein disulfide isomerase-like 5-4 [Camellia sinensis]XP_028097503.1 protein disulfide isomerase-like 5-4 [Camellia sinensis]